LKSYSAAISPITVPIVLNTPWMNPNIVMSKITILFPNSYFMAGLNPPFATSLLQFGDSPSGNSEGI